MNQIATHQPRVPMDSVSVSNTSTGSKLAPQNLGEVVRFAEVMARADIALPKHLRGNAGACMAVAMQALEWGMSPFAVASKSYAVNGAIAYEAQLIAAVVNTRSGIKGRLRYQFDDTGPAMTCTVTGVLDGEECVYTSPSIGSITTKNSPLWKSDPQQQLGYFSARSWARRHCPEVILGVYDRDEAEEFRGPDKAKDITPAFDPLSDEPIATQRVVERDEPVSGSDYPRDTFDATTGEITDTPDTGDTPAPVDADTSPSVSAEAAGSPSPAASKLDVDLRRHLMDFARKGFKTMSDASIDDDGKDRALDSMVLNYREVIDTAEWPKLDSIGKAFAAVLTGKRTLDQARSFVAVDLLDCKMSEIGG